MSKHTVSLYLTVQDPDALFEAAFHYALDEDEVTAVQAIDQLRPDGEIDVEACLTMLLDPGSIPGCKIEEAQCDEGWGEES